MQLKIFPTANLRGYIRAPPSKSYSHRVFIASSLADGISIIHNPLVTGDVNVTIEALKKLGVKILKETDNKYIVEKPEQLSQQANSVIDCKNSGTTLRILSVLSLLLEQGILLEGEFLRRNRPILDLLQAIESLGGEIERTGDRLRIKRVRNSCDIVRIRGDISSQFITALLMICPLLECDQGKTIRIELTTALKSYPYIEITKQVLERYGITFVEDIDDQKKGRYFIISSQRYRSQSFDIPGDFSSAASIIGAAVLTPDDSNVTIDNLNYNDPQGDKALIPILEKMGADIKVDHNKNSISIKGNRNKNPLSGTEIDCGDNPDLFPILAVIGAIAQGKTTLYNAAHLRYKESDRISSMSSELKKMGVKLEEEEDKLTIHHTENLKCALFDHYNDHRIAMALIIAALFTGSKSKMNNVEIISDSYPNFITDLKKLGANIEMF